MTGIPDSRREPIKREQMLGNFMAGIALISDWTSQCKTNSGMDEKQTNTAIAKNEKLHSISLGKKSLFQDQNILTLNLM